MKTRFIGDVHGKYGPYKQILKDCLAQGIPSVQVGDMGVGFRVMGHGGPKFSTNPPHEKMVKAQARFIRGNHDNPDVCSRHSQWIKDGKVEGDVMYIGGATSIDRARRTEGMDWWPDEQCSYNDLNDFISVYEEVKPRVMVTHEVPEFLADGILRAVNRTKLEDPSRTRQAFQQMLEINRPEIWISGHWHVDVDQVIKGTRFIVLNELNYIDLDI